MTVQFEIHNSKFIILNCRTRSITMIKNGLMVIALSWLAMSCGLTSETPRPAGSLRFSADTVFFDTVFTSVGSVTKRLRVFNDSKDPVTINSIALGSSQSPYRLIVSGEEGSSFQNTRILGEDSILLLVSVEINPMDEDLPFIVKDSIVFNTEPTPQDVKLISWGQDAHFLNDSILACNTTWTGDRPYVIFNSVLVDSLCHLTIEEGAQIFSHNGSSIFVQGTIDVQGSAESPVVFRNDRLDERFENAPGQWRGIFFLEGSKGNTINNAVIRNAEFGIWLGTPDEDDDPDLVIRNSIIENMANTGLIAFTSDLHAENLLINNCAEFVLGNFAGGNYSYNHCTFANFSFDFFRQQPSVAVADNFVLADNSVITGDINLTLTNSIIWGGFADELLLDQSAGQGFVTIFDSNIIRSSIANLGANAINADPLFIDAANFDYRLDTLSPAKDQGITTLITIDLDGNMRDANPDLGAYERIE